MKRMIAMVLAAAGMVTVCQGELPKKEENGLRLEGQRNIGLGERAKADVWNALDAATEGVVSWTDMAGRL